MRPRSISALALGVVLTLPTSSQVSPGTVQRLAKISQTQGGIMPLLDVNDQLGRATTVLGDMDGNGVIDLASGGLGDDDGGLDQGAAYVLFLRSDGKVIRHQKISALAGNFLGDLDPGDQFGRDMNGIGDLDGDGVPDLAVGANYDDDGGVNKGAVWILFLNSDGTVRAHQKISQTQGGFVGPLRNNDEFGRSVIGLGDLDGDGLREIAVGAPLDATGGFKRGAVYILSLRSDGTVAREVKVASGTGGFTGRLRNADWFGFSLANLGDFDGDGVTDLAVGAALDDDGAVNAGAAWLLYLNANGTVKEQRKISMLSGNFTAVLASPYQFGTSVTAVGDLNGDGITELAVGAVKDGDVGTERGAVYILFLAADGTVAFHQKLSQLQGGLPARTLDSWDWFGSSLAPLGDFNRDGFPDLAIGARNDDDGGANKGAIYLSMLNGSSSALLASFGPTGPGAGSPASSFAPARPNALAVGALGRGPEPDGSLELLTAEPEAGADLVLRLRVPEALAGRAATVRLFAATTQASTSTLPEPGGLLLEREALLGSLEAMIVPGEESVELSLVLPRRILTTPLRLQGLWLAEGVRLPTDALQLSLAD
jgi:hypothetical protein